MKNKYNDKKYRNKVVKSPRLEDDYRRVNQFKRYLKNKDILDFGCGWGGFLKNIKNYKSLYGIELRKECINHIQNNIKKLKCRITSTLLTKNLM